MAIYNYLSVWSSQGTTCQNSLCEFLVSKQLVAYSYDRFLYRVEMRGFEPLTPCLQGRCSPNWATPPKSPLSYWVTITAWVLFNYGLYPVGLSGLEPPTSRLSGVRSNQLSYKPFYCQNPLVDFRLVSLLTFFIKPAATCSPTPSPVQYHQPLRS